MPAYGWGSTPFPVYHVYPPPPGSAEEHHQRCASPPAGARHVPAAARLPCPRAAPRAWPPPADLHAGLTASFPCPRPARPRSVPRRRLPAAAHRLHLRAPARHEQRARQPHQPSHVRRQPAALRQQPAALRQQPPWWVGGTKGYPAPGIFPHLAACACQASRTHPTPLRPPCCLAVMSGSPPAVMYMPPPPYHHHHHHHPPEYGMGHAGEAPPPAGACQTAGRRHSKGRLPGSPFPVACLCNAVHAA